MNNKVAIVGVGMSSIGRHQDKTNLELALEVIKDALKDARIKKSEIEGIFLTPEGFTVRNSKVRVARLAEYLQISPHSVGVFECGGVSAMLACRYAANEIALGHNKINMVLASEIEIYEEELRSNMDSLIALNALFMPYDSAYGIMTATPYYAMSTQRYMYEYGATERQIANLAVTLRENATKNEKAMYRKKMTIDDVLTSRLIVPPIHLFETCPMADGCAAIILASEEIAKEITPKPIFITGIGEFHDASHLFPNFKPITSFVAVEEAAREAYKMSGRSPEDIDVAEVYGAFAGAELIIYEDLGFFKRGEAAKAVEEGKTRIGGEIPCNTSGGRLSLGHPPYVTPLLEMVEVALQLRGEAQERQVKDARIGLVHSEHGVVNGSIVMILERGL